MTVLSSSAVRSVGWRTPAVIVLCGCLISLVTFGPRSALGLFLTPISQANGWGRDVFALALAIQNLVWGIGLPFAGAVADRYGTVKVLTGGALLYAAGLVLMAYSTTPLMLDLSAGVLIGLGLSGASFNLVLAAFTKILPENRRSMALGAGTAAGSFGQFLFSPLGAVLSGQFGWQTALMMFAAALLIVVPLSVTLASPRATPAAAPARPWASRAGWRASPTGARRSGAPPRTSSARSASQTAR